MPAVAGVQTQFNRGRRTYRGRGSRSSSAVHERALKRWAEGRAADLAILEPPTKTCWASSTFYFHSERRVEVGYVVAPEARGRGFATRALVLVSRWGFESFPTVGR